MTENQSPPAHSQRYIDALGWAAELHWRQQRKGKTVPYIAHLIAVSSLVWEDGGQLGHLVQKHREELAIAGLLHDAIEDAGVSREEIAARFGERVAQIVVGCTDNNGTVQAPQADLPAMASGHHQSSVCPLEG